LIVNLFDSKTAHSIYDVSHRLSILFSLYTKENPKSNNSALLPVVLSGLFLGLSIFTKIPAFTMVPLVGLLFTKITIIV
jgi:hypothetical protein